MKLPETILRPGTAPDTAADSDAGETWLWLGDVDFPGDCLLSRRTIAFMYQGGDDWCADCCIPGCGLIFKPAASRQDIESAVDAHLTHHRVATVVDDPNRQREVPR